MGALIFGMGYGFYLNFIGIMIGSIINFILARKLGRPFVELLVDQNKFQKYTRWLDDESPYLIRYLHSGCFFRCRQLIYSVILQVFQKYPLDAT